VGGNETPFGNGTYIPDPLAQFLGRVVPWSVANPPDSFVNIHAFGGNLAMPYRGGGRAFGGMDEYGQLQNFTGFLNHIQAQVFFCLSGQGYTGQTDGRGNRKLSKGDRKATNARWLRSLVLDLDVKDKGYASQGAALAALLPFFDKIGIRPGPIVSTGHGIHAYIVLDQPITRAVWQPLADRLIEAATQHGLKFDHGVTRNSVTLLRLPGSFNRKDPNNPKECKVLSLGETMTLAEVTTALSGFPLTSGVSHPPRAAVIDPAVLPPRPPIRGAEANRALASLDHSRIVTSIELLRGACPVVADSERRGGSGDLEPLWFELAKLCHYVQDGRDYFHDLSSDDGRYDPEQTDAKFDIAQPQGWPACATIARASTAAAAICRTCQFNGQGQSPINYATRGLSGSGTPTRTHMNGSVNGHAGPVMTHLLPLADEPIFLPPGFIHTPDHLITDGENNPVFLTPVYSMTYLDGTAELPVRIEFCIARGTQGFDDKKTFFVPLGSLKSDQSFAEHCFGNGLMYSNFKQVKPYMTAWVTLVQQRRDGLSVSRMGWLEKDGNIQGFAYGGRNSAPEYQSCGELSEWKKGASFFVDKGCIEMEVLIATAFASPLMRFTGVDGGIVHARAPSGRGKTASLEIACSVWASMRAVLGSGTPADTREYIAMIHNLPVYADEFVVDARSNFSKVGEMVLNITGAKDHRRLTRNATRKPQRYSQLLLTTAGNFSLVQKTSRETTAQALRVVEIELSNAITKLGLTLDRVVIIKRLLESNHGTAGTVYADYLNQHYGNVDQAVVLCTQEFQKELNAVESERFWLATIVAIYLGATIAKHLNLLDFDIMSMKKFLFDQFRHQRMTLSEAAVDADDPQVALNRISTFVNERISNMIVTNGIARQGTNPHTKEQIKNQLYDLKPPYVGRIATSEKIMLLSEPQIESACRKSDQDFHHMRRVLLKAGFCTRPKNQRSLGAGTELKNPPAREYVWEFDLSKPENARFLNVE